MKKLLLIACSAVLVGTVSLPCSAAGVCAAGYIKSIEYNSQPGYEWAARLIVTVDQTGMTPLPVTSTFTVGLDGNVNISERQARFDVIRTALEEAMHSRFPILVNQAYSSCTQAASAYSVKVCSNEADCHP